MKFPAMLARTLLAVFPMPDRLIERTLRAFSDELSSDAPVPGGGSAAAYAGAMGAALAAMVARIAARKNGSDELRSFVEEVDNLRADFLRLVDDDSAAYARVAEALKLGRGTEEEKKARQERLQAALLAASRVPLEVAKTSRRRLERVRAAARRPRQAARHRGRRRRAGTRHQRARAGANARAARRGGDGARRSPAHAAPGSARRRTHRRAHRRREGRGGNASLQR